VRLVPQARCRIFYISILRNLQRAADSTFFTT
jgi:hypothetical protein